MFQISLSWALVSYKTKIHHRNASIKNVLRMNSNAGKIPNTEKTRLKVKCTGEYIDSALFRADLKKELTFFRGCSCVYNYNRPVNSLEIIAEGKTKNLERFLNDWLTGLTTDLSQRKPNFQGPAFIIKIDSIDWESFQGNIKGFAASEEAPVLHKDMPQDGSTMEAKNMAGTDESV